MCDIHAVAWAGFPQSPAPYLSVIPADQTCGDVRPLVDPLQNMKLMRVVSRVPASDFRGILAAFGVVSFPGISPTSFAVPSVERPDPVPVVPGLVLLGGIRYVKASVKVHLCFLQLFPNACMVQGALFQ